MAEPPNGISAEQWHAARIRAAGAEIDRLMKTGGFAPADVIRAFLNGWCDSSGNVAAFLSPATHADRDTDHPFAACGDIDGCPKCQRFVERFFLADVIASPCLPAETKRI